MDDNIKVKVIVDVRHPSLATQKLNFLQIADHPLQRTELIWVSVESSAPQWASILRLNCFQSTKKLVTKHVFSMGRFKTGRQKPILVKPCAAAIQ